MGWTVVAVLGFIVVTNPIIESTWDPYSILNIDTGATVETIKKTYRRMSLKLHPDKVPEEEKEAAESKFVELSKAYKALTNEEARKNWEEWGNPDGRQCTHHTK